jgi:hypothetical protein
VVQDPLSENQKKINLRKIHPHATHISSHLIMNYKLFKFPFTLSSHSQHDFCLHLKPQLDISNWTWTRFKMKCAWRHVKIHHHDCLQFVPLCFISVEISWDREIVKRWIVEACDEKDHREALNWKLEMRRRQKSHTWRTLFSRLVPLLDIKYHWIVHKMTTLFTRSFSIHCVIWT